MKNSHELKILTKVEGNFRQEPKTLPFLDYLQEPISPIITYLLEWFFETTNNNHPK